MSGTKLVCIVTESGNEESIHNCYDSGPEVRCENCKHHLGQDVPYMAGNCAKLVQMNPAGCVDPDFFCALWESKA